MRIGQWWQGVISQILMFEGISYHNQLKHFVYTANPGPALILPDYSGKSLMETNQNEELV